MVLIVEKFGMYATKPTKMYGGMNVDAQMDELVRIAKKEKKDKLKHKRLMEAGLREKADEEKYENGYCGIIRDTHRDCSAYIFDNVVSKPVADNHGAIHARTSNNTVHHLIPRNVIKEDD